METDYRKRLSFESWHINAKPDVMNRNDGSSFPTVYLDLSEYQFGFRKNSSTTLAVSKICAKILNNIDQGMYTCCIFLDLKKAFDTVNQYLLLQKLKITYGFRDVALDIMKSY